MYPFDRHERLRKNLAAYVDGELSPRETETVEKHLAGCETCVGELQSLRVAAAALDTLSEADAPRSFMLTPDMVAGPQPAPARAPSPALTTGLRLAAAGLAAALAAVMVADNADFRGGDDSPQESQVQDAGDRSSDMLGATAEGAPEESAAEADGAGDSADGDAVGGAEVTSAPAAEADAVEGASGAAASPAARNTGDAQAAAPVPDSDDSQTGDDYAAGSSDAGEDEEALSATDDETNAGGTDVMVVLEVALAALLGAAIGGILLLWIAQRQRSG